MENWKDIPFIMWTDTAGKHHNEKLRLISNHYHNIYHTFLHITRTPLKIESKYK